MNDTSELDPRTALDFLEAGGPERRRIEIMKQVAVLWNNYRDEMNRYRRAVGLPALKTPVGEISTRPPGRRAARFHLENLVTNGEPVAMSLVDLTNRFDKTFSRIAAAGCRARRDKNPDQPDLWTFELRGYQVTLLP